jgi:predicted aspartyl protease
MRLPAALLGCTIVIAIPSCGRAACRKAADVPLRLEEGFPVVAASVGSTPVSFLLDTGAQAHLVLPDAAKALGLRVLPGQVPVIGTGGARQATVVMLERVRLGGIELPPAPTPVSDLPTLPTVTPMLAGLLGAPVLASYDLELAASSGRIGLYEAGACDPSILGGRTTILPLTITPAGEALLSVRLNGHELVAQLDTGSRATLLTQEAARQLGLRAPISANTARGVDGERLPLEHVRVSELAVGEDVRRNAPVSIAPLQLGPAQMLLGMDYLQQRHVWISYATGQLAIALPGPAPSIR